MIKKYKTILNILVILIISLILTACHKEIPPVDSAIAYFEFTQKGNRTENLPLDDESVKLSVEESKRLTTDNLLLELEVLKIDNIPDDVIDKWYTKYNQIGKLITPKVEEISKEGDTAVVKLTSKPININSKVYQDFMTEKMKPIQENIINEMLEEYSERELAKFSEAEIEEKIFEKLKNSNVIFPVFDDLLDEIQKNPIYSEKEHSVNITMKKVDGNWVINARSQLEKLNQLVSL